MVYSWCLVTELCRSRAVSKYIHFCQNFAISSRSRRPPRLFGSLRSPATAGIYGELRQAQLPQVEPSPSHPFDTLRLNYPSLDFARDKFFNCSIFPVIRASWLLSGSYGRYLSACRHIATPAVAEVPMVIIDKLEVREGELLLEQLCELLLNRLSPLANEHDELIDVPSHSASGDLRVVASKPSLLAFSLSLEILLCPDLPVQFGVVDERNTFLSRLFHFARCEFLLMYPKEPVFHRIVPENPYARHLLVEGGHVLHLRLVVFIVELGHLRIVVLMLRE